MERPPSDSGTEPQGISKGHCTEQKSHASDREPLGTPSRVAQVGYSDPSSFCTMMRDILFEKSPKSCMVVVLEKQMVRRTRRLIRVRRLMCLLSIFCVLGLPTSCCAGSIWRS